MIQLNAWNETSELDNGWDNNCAGDSGELADGWGDIKLDSSGGLPTASPCKYFQLGSCNGGNKCVYTHDDASPAENAKLGDLVESHTLGLIGLLIQLDTWPETSEWDNNNCSSLANEWGDVKPKWFNSSRGLSVEEPEPVSSLCPVL